MSAPSFRVIEGTAGFDFPSEPAREDYHMPSAGFWRRAIAGAQDNHELRKLAWSLAAAYEESLVSYFEATGQHAPQTVVLQTEIDVRPDLEGCESEPIPAFAS